MAFNPEVQKKAQQEIHSVVGSGRLPDSNDRDSLPYVQAIILETLRWKPVVPLNTPHALIEDDEYRGFLIPKDTVVIAVSEARISMYSSLTIVCCVEHMVMFNALRWAEGFETRQ